MRKPVKKTPSSKMRKPVKKTSSSDEAGELNVQPSEQPESSGSNRVRKSEQRGRGKEMVDVRGRTKVEASSYHQSNKGDRKIKGGIKAGDNDQKIRPDESWRELIREQIRRRENLVKENEILNTMVQKIRETLRELEFKLKENSPMHVDSPKDMGSPVDPMEIDPPEGKINAPIPLPIAIETLITQGTETSQTEVSMSDIIQFMEEMKATNKKLEIDNTRLKSIQAAHDEILKIRKKFNERMENNVSDACYFAPKIVLGKLPTALDGKTTCHPTSSTFSSNFISNICQLILHFASQNHLLSTAGDAESREITYDGQASTSALGIKGTTDIRELKKRMKNNVSDACYFAPKIVLGKLPTAVDGTSTCCSTSGTFSSNFTSTICQLILQFASQNHPLSTAGDAESREATHDEEASTSALGIKCTTDVQELEKHMENSVSQAYYFAVEIARAERESRAMNAEEEDGDNQAIETTDSDN